VPKGYPTPDSLKVPIRKGFQAPGECQYRHRRPDELTPAHYAMQVLLRFGMEECAEVQTPMEQKEDWTVRKEDIPLNEEGKRQYQAAIGSLIYLMLGTRPDLSY